MYTRFIVGLVMSLSACLSGGARADYQEPDKGKILMVVSSPATALNGWDVGFWMAELSHPYYELTSAGYQVEIASTQGGAVQWDAFSDPRHESGYSVQDFVSLGFLTSPATAPALEDTVSIADIDHEDYAAIVIAGGVAPMFTFRDNETLQGLIAAFYESGRPTAALCHGVTALLDVTLSDGRYLVEGRNVTAFSRAEDRAVEASIEGQMFDWYVEDALRARGARYMQGGLWADFAVSDGNLITGQQQYSGRTVGQMVIAQLSQ